MSLFRAGLSSLFMGSGICAMHYIGMASMRLPAMHHYNLRIVTLSFVLAVISSFVALSLTFSTRDQSESFSWRETSSAVIIGSGIPLMHYVGMASVTFTSMPTDPSSLAHAINMSSLVLAGIAAATAFILVFVCFYSILDRKALLAFDGAGAGGAALSFRT